MSHFRYEAQLSGNDNIVSRLNVIKNALDECSLKSSGFASEMQRGLEGEGVKFKQWAETLELRRDSVRRASETFTNAIECYHDAEQSVRNRMSEVYRIAGQGGAGATNTDVGAASAGNFDRTHLNNIFNTAGSSGGNFLFPPGFAFWGGSESGIRWWTSLPDGLRWVYVAPVIFAISAGMGFTPGAVWQFMQNLFIRNNENSEQGGEREKESVSDSVYNEDEILGGMNGDYGTGSYVGAGEIDRPVEDFYDSQSGVAAQNGRSEIAVNLPYDNTKTAETVTALGVGAGLGTSAGSENKDADSTVSDSSILSKISTPLIGIGSFASVAAAGIGVAGNMRSNGFNRKKSVNGGLDGSILPIVEARQSGGMFAGNLNSNYVILASLFTLLFAGLSIASGIMKKREKKSDDLFRVGYGISAIFNNQK